MTDDDISWVLGGGVEPTDSDRTMGDIERIPTSPRVVLDREELDDLVEEPLLPACRVLYDLGVRTVRSSANRHDVRFTFGSIEIDYRHLSAANKVVAGGCARRGDARYGVAHRALIKIPISGYDQPVSEFQLAAIGVARRFRPQAATWTPRWSYEELLTARGISSVAEAKAEGATPESFVEGGYFRDEASGLFYANETSFRRAKGLHLEKVGAGKK